MIRRHKTDRAPCELKANVERILLIPVSISYTETMSSGFYQYTSFIVTGSIWNTCYLEYSHTLLVSASFTGITHYLYTIGFLAYLDNQSTLIPQSNMHQERSTTFNKWTATGLYRPPRNTGHGLSRTAS